MATLPELIYDLWEAVEVEVPADTVLDERKLEFLIHKQRALWIRNELNKNRTIDESIKQNVSSDLEDFTSDTFEYCKVTEDIIPTFIEVHNKPLITKLHADDLTNKALNLIDYVNIPYTGHGKFNTNQIFASLIGNRIYLLSNDDALDDIASISIEGVFENPSSVESFDSTKQYPIQMWMWNYIKGSILKHDLSMLLGRTPQEPSKEETNAEEDSS